MKNLLVVLALLTIIFLAGCKPSQPEVVAATTTVATSVSTSILDIVKEASGFDTENCPKQFLRKQYLPDGSIKEFCLPPDYFDLEPCETDKDCENVEEECLNGFCDVPDTP